MLELVWAQFQEWLALDRDLSNGFGNRIRIEDAEDERAGRKPEAESDVGIMGPALLALVFLHHRHMVVAAFGHLRMI